MKKQMPHPKRLNKKTQKVTYNYILKKELKKNRDVIKQKIRNDWGIISHGVEIFLIFAIVSCVVLMILPFMIGLEATAKILVFFLIFIAVLIVVAVICASLRLPNEF